jgi:hypothetical protein
MYGGSPFGPIASEVPFQIGAITYTNGTIPSGTEADSVDLVITLTFTQPDGIDESFDFTFQLINTTNTSDPDESADFVFLPSLFPSSVFVVDDVAYTLELTGFQNVLGDGFLVSDATQFHVREQGTASAELWGKVTTNVSAIVPEPSTCAMGIAGALVGIGYAWRRRRLAWFSELAGVVPAALRVRLTSSCPEARTRASQHVPGLSVSLRQPSQGVRVLANRVLGTLRDSISSTTTRLARTGPDGPRSSWRSRRLSLPSRRRSLPGRRG